MKKRNEQRECTMKKQDCIKRHSKKETMQSPIVKSICHKPKYTQKELGYQSLPRSKWVKKKLLTKLYP